MIGEPPTKGEAIYTKKWEGKPFAPSQRGIGIHFPNPSRTELGKLGLNTAGHRHRERGSYGREGRGKGE